MFLGRKRRISRQLVAIVVGGSMTLSGFYWNLVSEPLGRRISGNFPQVAPARAAEMVDAISLLWSSVGLTVILVVLARVFFRARRVNGR
ncbi:hypothetical protein JIG36_47585 [Actinoplanes sp. LDG1-06]|uniref:Uncharacterized protein n=1 Tax=Paractinoplanes ovalisporus TaxID=2810368 RepID=A0ABS2ATY1_9ACTN|nr:hypothetical protein [Actinoplanes ovalisporus]MBM2623185.1 hypothetical protein [Actinoplanes ovalisporus]